MFNGQYESNDRTHVYKEGFFNVLSPGKGKGFQWALKPLASNLNYPKFIKGQF